MNKMKDSYLDIRVDLLTRDLTYAGVPSFVAAVHALLVAPPRRRTATPSGSIVLAQPTP